MDEVMAPVETQAAAPEAPAAPEQTASPESGQASGDTFYSGNVPKELEGAHREMQASYTRKMQALSQQERQFRSQPQTAYQPPAQVDPNAGAEAYAPQVTAMETEVRQIKLQLLDQQIDRFAETHKDVYEHANDMADAMMQVPGLTMEKAYWMIKGPKAEQNGRAEAMKLMQTKISQPQGGPVGSTSKPAPSKPLNSIADFAREAYNSASK